MGIIEIKYKFLLVGLITSLLQLFAQENNSLNYNNHIVLKGETSYGIAKKYKIDLNSFFDANPGAADGINKGDTLKIPHLNNFKDKGEIINIDSSIKIHEVKKGETLWSLAKEYGVKVELIKSFNNLLENELNLNQKIYIPNTFSDTNDLVSPIYKTPNHPLLKPCDTLIIHKVKKRETLYGIASKYNVSIEKIINNNPELNEKGLQKDHLLKVIYRLIDCDMDSIINWNNELSKINHSKLHEKSLNISVLLPFSLDMFDTISKNCEDPSICPLPKSTVNSLKIFNGFQIAFQVLKKEGYNLNINVFDTKYDTSVMNHIFEDSLFKSSHLILGPIFSKNIKLTRTFSRTTGIPIVSYFDLPNKALFKYPDLFKFYPSNATQIQFLANYFRSKKEGYNYVILGNEGNKKSIGYSKVFANTFNDTLVEIDSNVIFDSIMPLYLSRGDNFTKVNKLFSIKDTNVIIIADTDIPFMTYVFNKLIELSNSEDFYNYKFMISGFEELMEMNTIDDRYKNKFSTHFVSKGMIDYKSDDVNHFINDYQKEFNMHTDEVSIIAYDLVLSIFNSVFPTNASNLIYNGLFNKVNYQKIGPESGYENKAVKLYKYNNYFLQQIFED